MPKLNSATAGIQTAGPWVIGSKPDALTSVYFYGHPDHHPLITSDDLVMQLDAVSAAQGSVQWVERAGCQDAWMPGWYLSRQPAMLHGALAAFTITPLGANGQQKKSLGSRINPMFPTKTVTDRYLPGHRCLPVSTQTAGNAAPMPPYTQDSQTIKHFSLQTMLQTERYCIFRQNKKRFITLFWPILGR